MQDEGKDGESEEDSNKIVYDDKMIADMLDRNKVAEEEKAVAYNDYLQVMSHLLLSVASSALAIPFFGLLILSVVGRFAILSYVLINVFKWIAKSSSLVGDLFTRKYFYCSLNNPVLQSGYLRD